MSYTASPPLDLELKSSELPPGCTAPLRAPADGRLIINGKAMLLRLVRLRAGEFVLYARWDERNALVLRNGAPQIWKGKPTPQKLRAVAGYFASDNSWKFAAVHIVPSPQNGRAVVALNRNLHPSHSYPTDCALTDNTLRNLIPFEADVNSNRTEFGNIMANLRTPCSFANFSWRWLQSDSAQRDEIWNAEVTKLDELEKLMTWILCCVPELWEKTNALRLQHNYQDWSDSWYCNADPQASSYLPLSPAYENWIEAWSTLLAFKFQPTHLVQLQNHVKSQANHLTRSSALISQPTAHEQLEAHLNLSNWLQHNAPKYLEVLSPR